jgi:hypothetical protein
MDESVQEGEERSIIQDAVVDHLIDTFGGQNWMIFADTREQLEAKMYDEIETLSVDEVVDSNMEVGGQPIGNFASGRVLDVIDSSSAIESAMQHVEGLDEGKSPHKKGSAKYKKHMAAMHAENKDEVDGADYSQDGMIGTPDGYYDAEQRQEAYRDLKDALDGAQNWQEDSIKDGICPECAGSGYMDGEYEDEDGNEGSERYGWGEFGCDEGEMTQRDDGLPNWAEIAKHDERQMAKANKGPAPDKETIMKVLPRLHDDYVKSGKYNAMELPGILRQMYPELGKREAAGYTAEFFKTFSESVIHEGEKGEGEVAKMLSKALGDENRWTEMSPYELFAELESQNPEVADMLAKVAKQLYDVKLKERTYKDVGVADVQKDPRGKEFKFDKDSKQFKSQDGELAAISTKVGKDLMKKRKSAMRKSTPSAHKKKASDRPSLMSQIFGK